MRSEYALSSCKAGTHFQQHIRLQGAERLAETHADRAWVRVGDQPVFSALCGAWSQYGTRAARK